MICYAEYSLPVKGGFETRYVYYNTEDYDYDTIKTFIERSKKPKDCLDLTSMEHQFLQKAIDEIQKKSFAEGISTALSMQTLLNDKPQKPNNEENKTN